MTKRTVSVLALAGVLLLLVWQAPEVLLALFLRGGGSRSPRPSPWPAWP